MNLTERQRTTIINALRVAAGVYNDDAATMHRANEWRLAEQFRLQRDEAESIADGIEEGEL